MAVVESGPGVAEKTEPLENQKFDDLGQAIIAWRRALTCLPQGEAELARNYAILHKDAPTDGEIAISFLESSISVIRATAALYRTIESADIPRLLTEAKSNAVDALKELLNILEDDFDGGDEANLNSLRRLAKPHAKNVIAAIDTSITSVTQFADTLHKENEHQELINLGIESVASSPEFSAVAEFIDTLRTIDPKEAKTDLGQKWKYDNIIAACEFSKQHNLPLELFTAFYDDRRGRGLRLQNPIIAKLIEGYLPTSYDNNLGPKITKLEQLESRIKSDFQKYPAKSEEERELRAVVVEGLDATLSPFKKKPGNPSTDLRELGRELRTIIDDFVVAKESLLKATGELSLELTRHHPPTRTGSSKIDPTISLSTISLHEKSAREWALLLTGRFESKDPELRSLAAEALLVFSYNALCTEIGRLEDQGEISLESGVLLLEFLESIKKEDTIQSPTTQSSLQKISRREIFQMAKDELLERKLDPEISFAILRIVATRQFVSRNNHASCTLDQLMIFAGREEGTAFRRSDYMDHLNALKDLALLKAYNPGGRGSGKVVHYTLRPDGKNSPANLQSIVKSLAESEDPAAFFDRI